MDARHAYVCAGWFVAAATLAAGIGLAFLGWQSRSTALGLFGLALAIAAPAIAVATALARIELEPELFDEVSAAESALRYIRLARAHVCMLAAGALVYGFANFIGFIAARDFVTGYAVIVVAALAVYLPWLARQEKQTYDLREILRMQLRSASSGNLLATR